MSPSDSATVIGLPPASESTFTAGAVKESLSPSGEYVWFRAPCVPGRTVASSWSRRFIQRGYSLKSTDPKI